MKAIKYILLFIGSVALWASFFSMIKGDGSIINHVLAIVCGTSSILGYLQLNKYRKVKC